MSLLIRLFKALNANQHPGQIALSFLLGMILGLTPLFFAHNLFTLALILLLRINLSALIAATLFFSGISYLLDPLFHQVGLWLLQMDTLQPLFTELYNQAFWRWVNFNNTLVMGSVLVAYGLSLPAFFLFWLLVKTYRNRFLKWVNQFKIIQILKGAKEAEWLSGIVK
ncbi:DUF2062 domain-containing protein [Hydrogenovibrio sp. SC-1]|uniref:TIGR03546 family protein n=1 Tax=Hydrogenovibrio sp. SC-1 TaxID=2065820 RepID=UPI000C7C0FF7|nr:TIGR03546 family protein [Hydrogenovibrio sp. SC-1]PLA74442.1 DUF2062 domain-containing protein [Hydrogenovibrio sp. SC-1]